jgi:hypothetical protein
MLDLFFLFKDRACIRLSLKQRLTTLRKISSHSFAFFK